MSASSAGDVSMPIRFVGRSIAAAGQHGRPRHLHRLGRRCRPSGAPVFGDLMDLEPEHFDFVNDVNVRGVFLTAQRAGKLMIEGRRRRQHRHPCFHCCEASIRRCVQRVEGGSVDADPLARRRAGAARDPGQRDRPCLRHDGDAGAASSATRSAMIRQAQAGLVRRSVLRSYRSGQLPSPLDVANTALFLCSDEAASFTGSILHPDGGITGDDGRRLTWPKSDFGVPTSTLASGVSVHHGVEFATVEGFRPLLLDLYLPAPGTASGAAIVYVHGGGWAVGTRRRFGRAFVAWSPTPLDLLAQAGFVVATVDYRLSGEAHFPAQLHDVKAADSMDPWERRAAGRGIHSGGCLGRVRRRPSRRCSPA